MTEIRIKYFDTIPVASALNVLKTGFLFSASEFGNHALYQITHLGDDDDEPEFSSAMASELEDGETFFFHARDLQNLVLVDEMESLAPIMSCQVHFVMVSVNCYVLLALHIVDETLQRNFVHYYYFGLVLFHFCNWF